VQLLAVFHSTTTTRCLNGRLGQIQCLRMPANIWRYWMFITR